MNEKLVVQTQDFEGPLELLLRLIQERKLSINTISLASVTDDYIEKLNSLPENRYLERTHFLYVATTLLLIKSKSLLPLFELTEEEEDNVDELERRLKLLHVITQEAVPYVGERMKSKIYMHARKATKRHTMFAPDEKNMKLSILHDVMKNLLHHMPQEEKLPEIDIERTVSLEEMVHRVKSRIQTALKLSFTDLIEHKEGEKAKVERVVAFLAVLEMARGGIITLTQESTFTDISIEHV